MLLIFIMPVTLSEGSCFSDSLLVQNDMWVRFNLYKTLYSQQTSKTAHEQFLNTVCGGAAKKMLCRLLSIESTEGRHGVLCRSAACFGLTHHSKNVQTCVGQGLCACLFMAINTVYGKSRALALPFSDGILCNITFMRQSQVN